MRISEILGLFVIQESGITISDPEDMAVKKSYLLWPDGRDAIATPCFMHSYRPMANKLGPNSNRARDYEIRQQMFVAPLPGDAARKSELAMAFDEALSQQFATSIKLHDPAVFLRRDAEEPNFQPLVLEWNGLSYVGLEYHYKVSVHDTVLIGA